MTRNCPRGFFLVLFWSQQFTSILLSCSEVFIQGQEAIALPLWSFAAFQWVRGCNLNIFVQRATLFFENPLCSNLWFSCQLLSLECFLSLSLIQIKDSCQHDYRISMWLSNVPHSCWEYICSFAVFVFVFWGFFPGVDYFYCREKMGDSDCRHCCAFWKNVSCV